MQKKLKIFSTANIVVFFCGILSTANIFGYICVKNTTNISANIYVKKSIKMFSIFPLCKNYRKYLQNFLEDAKFLFFKNFTQIIADISTSKNISANIYVRNFFNSKYCRIFCGILSTANIFGNICVKNTIKNAVFFQQQILSYFFAVIKAPQIFMQKNP